MFLVVIKYLFYLSLFYVYLNLNIKIREDKQLHSNAML